MTRRGSRDPPDKQAPVGCAVLTLGLGVLALAACAFAPLKNPPAPAPANSYAAQSVPDTSVAADGVAQRFALGAQAVPEWWRQLARTRWTPGWTRPA